MKRRADFEGKEQAALFLWLKFQYPDAYEFAFHVPNGGHRHVAVAKKLKAEGVKAGVPDIFLMLPAGAYNGLVIEFKPTPPVRSSLSQNQREWLVRLSDEGYRAVVCKGLDAAMSEINDYLALR